MFCLESGGFIHVQLPCRGQEVGVPEPPAWLHSFIYSEDYLAKCPWNCFSGVVKQELGNRIPRSHRRRYFCTECPEEGPLCLGKIIELHLRHRILKVMKLTGVQGPVIKVGDIEPLVNISCIVRHSDPNSDLAYVKMKTYMQRVWGAGSKQVVPCFECLQVASIGYDHKYCSIDCAYFNTVEVVRTQGLNQHRGFIGFKSSRIIRLVHRRKLTIPAQLPLPVTSTSAPQSNSDSVRPPSSGWRSRLQKYLSFGSSTKGISQTEALNRKHIPLGDTSSQDRSSNRENAVLWHMNESEGEPRGLEDHPPDRIPSRRLEQTRQPQDNQKVKDRSPRSPFREGGSRASSQVPEDSWLSDSTTTAAVPRPRRVNGLNVKAGPVTTIYWRKEQDSGFDEEEVQKRWGAVRRRVLNSVGMTYATYKLENESKEKCTERVEVFVSGFELAAQHGRASQESGVHSGSCEITQARGYAPVINASRRIAGNPHNTYRENFTTRRNALFEMREQWGS